MTDAKTRTAHYIRLHQLAREAETINIRLREIADERRTINAECEKMESANAE